MAVCQLFFVYNFLFVMCTLSATFATADDTVCPFGRAGERCDVDVPMRTCYDYYLNGYAESGVYDLAIQGGSTGQLWTKIAVYCNMTNGTTEVNHALADSTTVFDVEERAWEIPYQLNDASNLRWLVNASTTCTQEVIFSCVGQPNISYPQTVTFMSVNEKVDFNSTFDKMSNLCKGNSQKEHSIMLTNDTGAGIIKAGFRKESIKLSYDRVSIRLGPLRCSGLKTASEILTIRREGRPLIYSLNRAQQDSSFQFTFSFRVAQRMDRVVRLFRFKAGEYGQDQELHCTVLYGHQVNFMKKERQASDLIQRASTIHMLTDGRWHTVTIAQRAAFLTVIIDGENVASLQWTPKEIIFDEPEPLHLRNIMLNGVPLFLNEAVSQGGAAIIDQPPDFGHLSMSCPIQSQCSDIRSRDKIAKLSQQRSGDPAKPAVKVLTLRTPRNTDSIALSFRTLQASALLFYHFAVEGEVVKVVQLHLSNAGRNVSVLTCYGVYGSSSDSGTPISLQRCKSCSVFDPSGQGFNTMRWIPVAVYFTAATHQLLNEVPDVMLVVSTLACSTYSAHTPVMAAKEYTDLMARDIGLLNHGGNHSGDASILFLGNVPSLILRPSRFLFALTNNAGLDGSISTIVVSNASGVNSIEMIDNARLQKDTNYCTEMTQEEATIKVVSDSSTLDDPVTAMSADCNPRRCNRESCQCACIRPFYKPTSSDCTSRIASGATYWINGSSTDHAYSIPLFSTCLPDVQTSTGYLPEILSVHFAIKTALNSWKKPTVFMELSSNVGFIRFMYHELTDRLGSLQLVNSTAGGLVAQSNNWVFQQWNFVSLQRTSAGHWTLHVNDAIVRLSGDWLSNLLRRDTITLTLRPIVRDSAASPGHGRITDVFFVFGKSGQLVDVPVLEYLAVPSDLQSCRMTLPPSTELLDSPTEKDWIARTNYFASARIAPLALKNISYKATSIRGKDGELTTNKDDLMILILGGVIGVLLVLALIVITCLICKRRKGNAATHTDAASKRKLSPSQRSFQLLNFLKEDEPKGLSQPMHSNDRIGDPMEREPLHANSAYEQYPEEPHPRTYVRVKQTQAQRADDASSLSDASTQPASEQRRSSPRLNWDPSVARSPSDSGFLQLENGLYRSTAAHGSAKASRARCSEFFDDSL